MTFIIADLDEKGTQEVSALARKLGGRVLPALMALATPQPTMTREEWARRVHAVAGSWQSDETADELEYIIYNARTTGSRRDAELDELFA